MIKRFGLNYFSEFISLMAQNKAYVLFCVLGTAFTFVFIIIILQLAYTLTGKVPPFVNADRTIEFDSFYDERNMRHRVKEGDVVPLLEHVRGKKDWFMCDDGEGDVCVDGKYTYADLLFVNAGYWRINQFDFVKGRPFTEDEYEKKEPVAIITDKMAKKIFNTKDVLGKKINIQERFYTIIGVVADYASLVRRGYDIWLPYSFNQYIPKGIPIVTVGVLPEESVEIEEMKQQVASVVADYFETKGNDVCKNIKAETFCTAQERMIRSFGYDMLKYGIPLALVFLLLIPAINIVTLNVTNVENLSDKLMLRRVLGATKPQVFMRMFWKDLALAFVGMLFGVVLVVLVNCLTDAFVDVVLLDGVDWRVVVFGVLPLLLVFTLLSGGFPACRVLQGNIAKVLKGDVGKHGWHGVRVPVLVRYAWILVEQVLVFVVLMLCVVSVSEAIRNYREPGLVETSDRYCWAYSLKNRGAGLSWQEQEGVMKGVDVLLAALRRMPFVEGVTESENMVPYIGEFSDYAWNSDTVTMGGKSAWALFKAGDLRTKEIFGLDMEEGDWWENDWLEDGSFPVVLSRQLAEKLGNDVVGKHCYAKGMTFTVVGVIDGLKQTVFGQLYPIVIMPLTVEGALMNLRVFCVKIAPGREDDLRLGLNQEFKRLGLDKQGDLICESMSSLEWASMSGTVTNLVMQSVPTVFLVFFAFIGTFGLFWLTAKRRRREFALRMVMGCTRRGLARLVVGESLCVTGLAMVPGLLLSFFIYDWTATQALAIGLTVLLMLLFSVFSAWWPARQVSRLRPADVLREE